jgi:ketosteroid isomerase-like protein
VTLDRAAFQTWLDQYIAAWRANDPAAVGELFAADAVYRHRPTDPGLRGREAIVADWEPEDPDGWDARYVVLAIDGEVHVASGETIYRADGDSPQQRYANVFVCRFDADGRCTDFTEWWTLDRAAEA